MNLSTQKIFLAIFFYHDLIRKETIILAIREDIVVNICFVFNGKF